MRRIYGFMAIAAVLSLAIMAGIRSKADVEKRLKSTSHPQNLARMSKAISIQAAGRGNSYINLSGGHDLLTSYVGDSRLVEALEANQVTPLSLASADFDEDGIPDLISGYTGAVGGIITLYRGNVDAIYPHSPEARQRRENDTYTDAPFLSPALVYQAPEQADFIGAGDFDGDSHWDVVTARRGSNNLYLFSGNGHCGLSKAKQIELPGTITAMTVGEINRRDGLDDLVVGITGAEGAKVLVFEGPQGALRTKPEEFAMSTEVSMLALGSLDDDYEMDLAIAAGRELVIVHGRDRTPSSDAKRQAIGHQAKISRRIFSSRVKSLALGNFTGTHKPEIALLSGDGTLSVLSATTLLENGQNVIEKISYWKSKELVKGQWFKNARLVSARLSSLGVDNLLVVDSANRQMQILTATEPRIQSANDGSMTESNSNFHFDSMQMGGNPVSVIPMRLNSDALGDLVILRSGHSAPNVIQTQAAMTFVVSNTNDSGSGSLRQAIFDANSNTGADAITFNIPGSNVHTISPQTPLPTITDAVAIDGTTQTGFAGKPLIELSGLALPPMTYRAGLEINAANCLVKGLVINGFVDDSGINIFTAVAQGNRVEGCYIGTNAGGVAPIINSRGIILSDDGFTPDSGAKNNIIGGTTVAARNIISGNKDYGILDEAASTSGNLIQGNYIGTDFTGTTTVANLFAGVGIFAPNNIIGGMDSGARNIISGNVDYGILISSDGTNASGNLVQGNYIGTNADGSAVLTLTNHKPDVGGVALALGARSNLIGGSTTNARNVISGNADASGVVLENEGTADNQIKGNLIGTDATGIRALGNGEHGVLITQAPGNTISNNIISANFLHGVAIGLRIIDLTGKEISGETGAIVQGNFIGTDSSGTAPLGNGLCGILVDADSFVNTIDGNLIAYNGTNGVCLPDNNNPAVKILIINNAIHSNARLGIDLGPDGVTENPGNRLTGANNLQNFPQIDSATFTLTSATTGLFPAATAVSMVVKGNINASANTTYTLQFFYGSDCSAGQGHQFVDFRPTLIDTKQVATDNTGIGPYNFLMSFTLPQNSTGGFINATATDPAGNTSEYSACTSVTGTIPIAGPAINNVVRSGKNLLVSGSGFVEGAKIFIDGEQKKTIYESTTSLTGKKAAKGLPSGVKIKVRNPDGSQSNEWTYQ